MEIIALCGIYIAELLCNSLSFLLLFHEKIRIKPVVAFGMLMPVVIGLMPMSGSAKNLVLGIGILLEMLWLLTGKWMDRIAEVMLTVIFIFVINDTIRPFSQKVFPQLYSVDYYIWNYLKEQIGTLIILIIVFAVYRIICENKFKRKINLHSYIFAVLAILAVIMMLCITVLNHVKIFWKNARFWVMCDVLNVAVHISIFFIVIFVIYIKNTNERMSELLKTEKLLKETQIEHYKQMLKKEEDTRKYRHDMINHLIYLNTKMSDGNTEEAEEYLGELIGNFQKIRTASYEVGNEMVDAIMNYHLGQLSDNVKIVIEGNCPLEFDMPDTDICTVFSNLFENIVEEFAGYQGDGAKVYLKMKHGRDYASFELKNTIVSGNVQTDHRSKLPLTHKQDLSKHGLGLGNVRQAVEDTHGKFSWSIKEEFFCIELILPVKK